MVVIYHAFAMYAGIWAPMEGLQQIPVYMWICKFAQGFHLEGMTFVAGYVFAFQCLDLNRRESFRSFTFKKAKRLFIPSIIFGCLYYFLFLFQATNFEIIPFLIQLLSGVAHMWYLPMLFWCFVVLWIINQYHFSSKWLLAILALVSIIPVPDIPFGLSSVNHFVFYAYLGYWLYDNRDEHSARYCTWRVATGLWLLFAVLCTVDIIIFHSSMTLFAEDGSFITKLTIHLLRDVLKLCIASSGILALYNTVELILPRVSEPAKARWQKASDISFGVYLCHQFILIGLYRHSSLFELVGSYWMPWMGLTVALCGSIVITYWGIKTKVGAFLLK